MELYDSGRMRACASFTTLADALCAAHRAPTDALEDMLLDQPAADGGDDHLFIRAAWRRGEGLGAKLVTIFPGNSGAGLPSIQGVYVLFDGHDGRPLAALDGTELTYWKTAADSALGARLLARPDCAELLMVGAGSMAPHLIRAHCEVLGSIRRVTIWNRSPARAEALAAAAPAPGVDYAVSADLEAAVARADLLCCATMTEAPIIRGRWLRPGQHLDLVGAYTPTMRECDDEAMRRARVFVDCRDTTLAEIGELILPIASGALTPGDVEADLYDMCRVAPTRSTDDITLYKNGDGGHLDLMSARYFVARLAGE